MLITCSKKIALNGNIDYTYLRKWEAISRASVRPSWPSNILLPCFRLITSSYNGYSWPVKIPLVKYGGYEGSKCSTLPNTQPDYSLLFIQFPLSILRCEIRNISVKNMRSASGKWWCTVSTLPVKITQFAEGKICLKT